jgi:NADPH:quinone reductase-like Zn-dependent oxidoreductase
LDAVVKSSFSRCRKILEKKGLYVSTIPNNDLFFYQALNFLRSKKAGFIMVRPSEEDLMIIADYIKKGLLHPYVQQTFPLEEGAKAHEMIETDRVRGKTVLSVIT